MKEWLLFIFFPFLLQAEMIWQADLQKPFLLTIQFDSQQITMAKSLHLEAEFHYPSSYQIDSNVLINQLTWSANPLTQQWMLVDSHLSSLSPEKEIEGQRLSLTLAPLMAGQLQLSFLTISFLSKDSESSPLDVSTPVFTFDVGQAPSKPHLPLAPLIPLEPQFPLELTQINRKLFIDNAQALEKNKTLIRKELEAHTFPWIALAILLGCGGLGWVLYLTHDRWLKPSIKPILAIPPKQHIDQALQVLKNRPFKEEQAPLYYTELASLLNTAIQARSGWAAQKMTTPELAQAMKKEPLFSADQITEALFLLKEMDQVKFAGKKPSHIETKQFIQQTEHFISTLF